MLNIIDHPHEGWIVICPECDGEGTEYFHTAQTYLGGTRDCEECGGRGFREATEQEIDERDIPPLTAEQRAAYKAYTSAALEATLAKIDAAFGRASA